MYGNATNPSGNVDSNILELGLWIVLSILLAVVAGATSIYCFYFHCSRSGTDQDSRETEADTQLAMLLSQQAWDGSNANMHTPDTLPLASVIYEQFTTTDDVIRDASVVALPPQQ